MSLLPALLAVSLAAVHALAGRLRLLDRVPRSRVYAMLLLAA